MGTDQVRPMIVVLMRDQPVLEVMCNAAHAKVLWFVTLLYTNAPRQKRGVIKTNGSGSRVPPQPDLMEFVLDRVRDGPGDEAGANGNGH